MRSLLIFNRHTLKTSVGTIRKIFGVAKFEHSSEHWKSQRQTAIIIFFLTYWLIYQIIFTLHGSDLMLVKEWLSNPINELLILLTVIFSLYHGELGLQVIIEDYIPTTQTQRNIMFMIRLLRLLLMTSVIISLIYLRL